jgi:hypothetical protein
VVVVADVVVIWVVVAVVVMMVAVAVVCTDRVEAVWSGER